MMFNDPSPSEYLAKTGVTNLLKELCLDLLEQNPDNPVDHIVAFLHARVDNDGAAIAQAFATLCKTSDWTSLSFHEHVATAFELMSKGRGSESTLKFGDVTRLLQRFFPGASPLNSAFSELLTSMTSLGKPRGYTGPVVISFYEFREVVLIGVLIREILAGVQLLFECDGPGNVRNSGNPQKTSSRKAVTFGPEQNATRVHKEEISKIIMGVLDRVNVGSVPSDFQDVVNRLLNALLFPSILSGQATSNAAEGEGDIRFDKPGPSAVNAAHNATGSTVTQEQFVGWIASRLRLIH